MATFHSGSWKIGGFALPDFGITERLTGNRTAQGGSNFVGARNAQENVLGSQAPQNYYQYDRPAGPPAQYGTFNQDQTTNASRSAIPSSGQTVSAIGQAQNNFNTALNQNRDQNLGIIDSQFNEEMGRLNNLEGRTRSNYASAIQQAQDYYPQFETQLNKERQTDLDLVTNRENQVKDESNRGLARTRQLLSDLQRSQAARMSATGNYSSSVADAFGESFGRKAFEANNQIQSARDQAIQQLNAQRQQTENFYSRKSLEAKQSYDQQLNQLQMQLQGQLDAINIARGTASSAKAQATAEAWQAYTNNKLNLDQQVLQYQMDLDSWMKQQQTTLDDANLWTTAGADKNLLTDIQGSAVGSPTVQAPQSQTQQAMILANKRPRYLEDQMMG